MPVPPARAAFLAAAVARGLVALPHAMAALLGPPGSPLSPWFGVLLGGCCGRAAASAAALDRAPSPNPVLAHAASAAALDGGAGVQAGSAAGARSDPSPPAGPGSGSAAERARGDAVEAAAEPGERVGGPGSGVGGGALQGPAYGEAAALEAWQAALPLEALWLRVAPLLQVPDLHVVEIRALADRQA